MNLLFDQNLSHRLVGRLSDIYPHSAHVRQHGLSRAPDALVWEFARIHGFTITSKDEDFHQRSFVFGAPPKVIWLKCGNSTTDAIEHLIRDNQALIAQFEADPELTFLVLK